MQRAPSSWSDRPRAISTVPRVRGEQGHPQLSGRGPGSIIHLAAIALAASVAALVMVAPSLGLAAADETPDRLTAGGIAPPGLDVVLDSTQHWTGTNDVLLSVYDASGRSLAGRSLALQLELTAPSGTTLSVMPVIEQFATYGRPLYRARLPLGELGRWDVHVSAVVDGAELVGSAVLDVSPDGGTPSLGSLVPGGDTPTIRDARSLLHHISSDPEPLTAFYTWSLDEALRQGQPTVLVLDSYAASPNAACGGALAILHEIFIDYPGLTIIHAEPWHTSMATDGMLQLDPAGGPPLLTDYAQAWGVEEPPWVFVIDRDGRLHAKFGGVVGSDELRSAMASVSSWRPVA
jgi:hypothetical protein